MLTAEIWTRPGDANFGRLIDGPPHVQQTLHKAMSQVGSGSMKLPNTFDRFDEILKTDEATPANSVSSLVRVFDTSDLTSPVGEWLPDALLPTENKSDLNVDVSGQGIKSIMDYARVEAYDWDGSDDWIPSFPDWIYGGDNLLSNPGFENVQATPTAYTLQITATGGTYTLTDGTDTTDPIAFDAEASTIQTRLETDIAALTDVIVAGVGGVFFITYVDPAFGPTLTVNTGSLTGGTATLTLTQEGTYNYGPWTRAAALAVGIPKDLGNYDAFQVSTAQSHSGTYSLLINPGPVGEASNRNAGAQQVVFVKAGGTYQASIWVYPTDAADEFRLAIFGVGEAQIAASNWSGETLTPNQWNELTISDVVMPDGVDQIIYRLQCTNQGPDNPSVFYIDDATLDEGLTPTTIGAIVSDLYDDAVTNHAGRVVWEDLANSPSPYLSIDFTDSVDSNGDAWFESAVSVRLWMRMSYRQVLDQFVRDYDIEWRVVPNDVEAGTWKLQIYNPGSMGTDYSAAQSPAIQGASSDVNRSIRRFLPGATNYMVEGELRITARRDTTGLESAVGRIEGSRLDRQLPSQAAVAAGALQDSVDEASNASPYVYDLVSPQETPLTAYDIGDILTIHDPPEVDDTGRLIDVEIVDTPNATIYQVQFFPTTPAGS